MWKEYGSKGLMISKHICKKKQATNQEEPERRTNMQHQVELENLGVCASQAKENTLINYMSISQEEEEERIEIRNLYWNIYRAVQNEESIKIAREPNV